MISQGVMLWLSMYPKSARPCRNAPKRGKERPCGARNPTRGILAVCCASEGKNKKVSARMTTVTTRVDTGISFRRSITDIEGGSPKKWLNFGKYLLFFERFSAP